MRLLRSNEVEANTDDGVFYYSRVRAALLVIALLAACIGFVTLGRKQGSMLSYYVAGILLLGLVTLRGYVTARFQPTNWLVRKAAQGVFIKFRSYLNHHLPEKDSTVVFISYPEIRSVRMLRQRIHTTDLEAGPRRGP